MVTPVQYNNFSAGLVTDFTDVNFPENALSKAINIEIKLDGSIARRKGFGVVSSLSYSGTTIDYSVFSAAGKNYIAVLADIGGVNIFVFDIDNNFTEVANYTIAPQNTGSGPFNGSVAANSKGIFVSVADEGLQKHYMYYLEVASDGSIGTPTPYSIKIRDLKGTGVETIDPSVRPTTLSVLHKYNLQNQGWFKDVKDYNSGALGKDVAHFKAAIGTYPSLKDDPALGIAVNASASNETRFRPSNITAEAYSDLIPSARGAVVFNPFDNNGDPTLAVSTADTTALTQAEIDSILVSNGKAISYGGYAQGLETYSSRVFYAGFHLHPMYKGTVFYSRLLETPSDAGVCYQEANPTSSTASDPLETDGGYITIPEAGNIFALKVIGKRLFVFASNGVWAIYGDQAAGGFNNLNYTVEKVSDIPAYSKRSMTEVEGALIYIGVGGIYTVIYERDVVPVTKNIIRNKILNKFREYSDVEKNNSIVAYDKENGIVYFVFGRGLPSSRMLVMRVGTGAFFEYNVSAQIDEAIQLPYMHKVSINVSNNGYTLPFTYEEVKFSVLFTSGSTLCQFIIPQYYDLVTTATYTSEFAIGPFNFKDLYHKKQAYRLITQMKRTESIAHTDVNGDIILEDESSLFVKPIWDYSSSALTGKVGRELQVYTSPRFVVFEDNVQAGKPYANTYEYDVHQTKRRLRGSGKALKLEFRSDGNKHFNVLGYALELQGRPRG